MAEVGNHTIENKVQCTTSLFHTQHTSVIYVFFASRPTDGSSNAIPAALGVESPRFILATTCIGQRTSKMHYFCVIPPSENVLHRITSGLFTNYFSDHVVCVMDPYIGYCIWMKRPITPFEAAGPIFPSSNDDATGLNGER